jgi:hypothetical protein
MEIAVDYKICNDRRSANCVKVGPSSLKWKGKCCPMCYKEVRSSYYQANKKEINGKITQKRQLRKVQVENTVQ